MPETDLRQTHLHIVFMDHLQKVKKEYKNIKKQEINDISITTN